MKYIGKFFKHLYLIILLILITIPVLYTISSSFKTNVELLAHPENLFPIEPTLDNYRECIKVGTSFPIINMFFNSLYYTVCSVIITVFLSAMIGYVFARGNFRGKKAIFALFCSLMFINLGSITMYPYFEILNVLHIKKGLLSLLLLKCFGMPIANVYLVRGFIKGIPYEIDEAAKIDGCSFAGIFFRIIIHMLKPILATIAILTFQGSWNDYLMPLIFTMTQPLQQTLIVGVMKLKTSGEAASSWNLMLAGTTISLIPVLVAYGFGNKYFVDGIAAGAVKG